MNQRRNHNIFSVQSNNYAAYRPKYPPQLYQYLASICAQRQQAWDCATGSGQCAIALAGYFDRVQATDISTEQMKYAPRHLNIEYSVQAAEKTNFTERQFDLITVAQALHWFDLEQFWSEVKRVLKPGGIFAAWGYGWAIISPEIDLLVNRLILERIKSYWLPGNRLVINQYRELDFPFTAIATPQDFYIEQMWTREQFFNYMSTWSAMKKYLAQAGASSIIEAENEIAKIWSDRKTKKVRMAICLKVGIND